MREAYREEGVAVADGMIRKITGSVDRVSDLIRKFKNEDDPRIAVTVDLLTTGIDVPAITNLVFLRRVNSRILYDQMIGRATRLCPEIDKEVFHIFDAVDLYPTLQTMTEMRPVVINPSVTFETLFDGLAGASSEANQQEIVDQIIVKLAREGSADARGPATSMLRRPARRRRCSSGSMILRDTGAMRPIASNCRCSRDFSWPSSSRVRCWDK